MLLRATAPQELWEELRVSGFVPVDFEVAFGDGQQMAAIEIPGGAMEAQLRGFVDRVDAWNNGYTNYFRVVDYKTGKKVFSRADLQYGLNMQMLIYLYATLKSERFADKIPAGVLYLETGKKVDEEKNFVMNGLLSQNTAVHDEIHTCQHRKNNNQNDEGFILLHIAYLLRRLRHTSAPQIIIAIQKIMG